VGFAVHSKRLQKDIMRRPSQAVFVALTASTLALAGSNPKKVSTDLQQTNPSSLVNVIIRYDAPMSKLETSAIAALGGKITHSFQKLNTVAAKLPGWAVNGLATDPNLSYISTDRQVSVTSLDYGAQAVNADLAWQDGLDGSGIGVAVIDSGIESHSDLNAAKFGPSRIVYSESFLPGDNSTDDGYGHGTHVAGIIAGNGSSSTGPSYTYTVKGISPNVNLINLRVLDSTGAGTDSDVIAAIERAIELKDQYGIRVINLSLGRPVFESYTQDPLCQAVEAAWKAGIVVVVAAGNDGRNDVAGSNGYGTINSPGNDPYVITVGAMKTLGTPQRGDDAIASYSSKGPTQFDHIVKPDIVAPGNRTVSLLDKKGSLEAAYPQNDISASDYHASNGVNESQSYYTMSGTSMATPVVSGTAALLLEQDPGLTPDQVKARLMKTASKVFPASTIAIDPTTGQTYVSYYDLFTVGAGYLDIAAALANHDLAKLPALSPVVTFDPATGNVYLVDGQAAVWGTNGTWSDTAVWGTATTAVWGAARTAVWGTTEVWGSSRSPAFALIWNRGVNTATNGISGTTAVWGSRLTAVWGTGAMMAGEN
jgi:serine protease AprX